MNRIVWNKGAWEVSLFTLNLICAWEYGNQYHYVENVQFRELYSLHEFSVNLINPTALPGSTAARIQQGIRYTSREHTYVCWQP